MTPAGRGLQIVVALLLLTGAPALAAEDDAAAPLSVTEYVAQLDAIVAAVAQSTDGPSAQLSALVNDVPRVWRVGTTERTFDIETGWLLREVQSWRTTRGAAEGSRLAAELRRRRSEAVAFGQSAPDVASERQRLTDILGRAEFRSVHGPNWMDRLRQRVLALLTAILRPLIRSAAIPTVTRLLVYGVIAAAFLVTTLWLLRILRRRAPKRAPVAAPGRTPAAAEWPEWLRDMEAAAARGNWREAIHLSYWCAVAFLEAKGAWRPDRSRTPREYLQLLPSASEDRRALTALTGRFELVWYGADAADSRLFAEAMANLEKMGCPPA